MAIFCECENFTYLKWPNIEQIIWPSGRTDVEVLTHLNYLGHGQVEESLHHGDLQPHHSVLQPADVTVAVLVDGKANLRFQQV